MARVICFPSLSEYRHQPIPALHIPCTAWNITFISMICHFHCCPRLFLYNTCRTSDGSAGVEHGRVYANVGGVHISDPDCNVTVCVMFWISYFSVVFCIHEIYIRRRKQWCLRLTVCHFHVQNSYYSTMPRQTCSQVSEIQFQVKSQVSEVKSKSSLKSLKRSPSQVLSLWGGVQVTSQVFVLFISNSSFS